MPPDNCLDEIIEHAMPATDKFAREEAENFDKRVIFGVVGHELPHSLSEREASSRAAKNSWNEGW